MWGKLCVAFTVAAIMSVDVDAQSTVDQSTLDDKASCLYSSSFNEAVNLFRADLEKHKREIKTACACGSNQQPTRGPTVDVSSLAICVPVLIQQNVDGSDFFNRSWEQFKVGFNSTRGNYWLGNDLLHQLTTSSNYRLRFDLQARNGSWYWAKYDRFVVFNESTNYKLQVSGYSGNAGDAFVYQTGMKFTTYDRDNDPWNNPAYNDNCAVWNGGGFWYDSCAHSKIHTTRGQGYDFAWYSPEAGDLLLQTTLMWLTC